jgi:cytochrome P450
MSPPPPGPTGDDWGRRNYEFWRADMFAFLNSLCERYGDIVSFDLGRSRYILVNHAPSVRELLLDREASLRKPEFVKDSNRGHWGEGLTTLEGAAWRERRRMLLPLFGRDKMPAWLSVAAQCTADMLDAWTDDDQVDVLRELRILTARIAVRAVLDAEVEGYGPPARSELIPFAEAYGEDYASTPGGDTTAPLIMVRPRAPRQMDAVVRIVDQRIASGERRGDVLSNLVHARLPGGDKIPRDEILAEVIQMLYAGHLTIPLAMANFWRDIAASDADAMLSAEAERLCATGAPDFAALPTSYGMAAVKESMRLQPPAPILYREVESAFELGGFAFGRNIAVWVSPQLLHNDARHFPEPWRFLPARFMNDDPRRGWPYLPFGAGPRACIAGQLALQQVTLIALLTARRFQVLPSRSGSNLYLRRRQPERLLT